MVSCRIAHFYTICAQSDFPSPLKLSASINVLIMRHSPSADWPLLARARQHDEAAFAALVDLYADPLFRIVQRMLADRMEAESIVQETFWRFWQALPRYDATRPLLPYLAAIASNLARDRHRRDARIVDVPVESLPEPEPASEAAGPEQLLEDQETLQRLSLYVRDLPLAYRMVIALRYEAGMSYEEIAAALSLPLNTVRTRLRRARERLRSRLDGDHDG